MKLKKATVDWMIIVGAIIVIVIGYIILNITSKGLFAGDKSADYLSACKNKGGNCEGSDIPNQNCFFKSGCPYDEDGNGKIDDKEKKNYCCIPK